MAARAGHVPCLVWQWCRLAMRERTHASEAGPEPHPPKNDDEDTGPECVATAEHRPPRSWAWKPAAVTGKGKRGRRASTVLTVLGRCLAEAGRHDWQLDNLPETERPLPFRRWNPPHPSKRATGGKRGLAILVVFPLVVGINPSRACRAEQSCWPACSHPPCCCRTVFCLLRRERGDVRFSKFPSGLFHRQCRRLPKNQSLLVRAGVHAHRSRVDTPDKGPGCDAFNLFLSCPPRSALTWAGIDRDPSVDTSHLSRP